MAYGAYEVVVYGGGTVFRDVFNAVALMSGTGPIDSLFRLTLVLGLLLGILKAMADFNFAALIRWFLMAAMIYGVLWVPKVQIHITDRFNSALSGADIANMPLGLAFAAATSSQIGDAVIKSTETAFADPSGLAYSDTGLIYGARLYDQMKSWRILDPLFAQNLEAFLTNCTYNDVISNTISVGDLENAANLWGFVRDHASPAAAFPYVSANDAQPSIITCQAGAANLDALWAGEVSNNESAQQLRLIPTQATSSAGGSMVQSLSALTTATGLASSDAGSTFQQVLTINAMTEALSGYAGQNGGAIVGAIAQTQTQLQTRDVQQMIGSTAQKALITLQIVITVLFIGLFPILAPMFLLPGLGISMMKGYFGGFIYLQLWGPMYVILNKVMMWQVYTQTLATTYNPGGTSSAITLANLQSLSSLNADLAGVAGCMAAAIPMIAAMLTKGAIAGAEAAAGGVMQTFQRSAEAAGTSAATGNYNYATSAVDTHQFHNTAGNRFDDSAFISTGQMSRVDSAGNTVTSTRDGTTLFSAGASALPFSAKAGTSIAAVAAQNHARYRDEGLALDHTFSQARTKVATKLQETSDGSTLGSTRTSSSGNDERSGMREVYDVRDQASRSLAKRLGISQSDADNFTTYASREIYGDAHLSAQAAIPRLSPINGGISGTAGARASAGNKRDHSQTDQSLAVLDAARQELHQVGFSKAVDHATQKFAADVWADNYGNNKAFREVTSQSFANSNTVSSTRRNLKSEGQRWQATEDFATRKDFSSDISLNNRIGAYFGDRYRAGDPVRDVHGEAVPLGALLNPVGPDFAKVSELREEALKRDVYPQYAQDLAAGPNITAAISGGVDKLSPINKRGRKSRVGQPKTMEEKMGAMVGEMLAGAPSRFGLAQVDMTGAAAIDRDTEAAGRQADAAISSQQKLSVRSKTPFENAHASTGAARFTRSGAAAAK